MLKFIRNTFRQLAESYRREEKKDFLAETELPEEEYDREKAWITLRNLFVVVAAILFLLSLILSGKHVLRAVAYFFGAGAYLSELVMLTDGFTRQVPRDEAFMAFCFGPLYVLMGIAYLLE